MTIPIVLSTGAAVWADLWSRQTNKHHPGPTADVTAAAGALGLQTLPVGLIVAANQHADNAQSSRLLPLVGLIAAPVVSTGVFAFTVRSALRRLNNALRNTRSKND